MSSELLYLLLTIGGRDEVEADANGGADLFRIKEVDNEKT